VPSALMESTKESPTLLEELSAEGLTMELCLRLSDGSSDMVLGGCVFNEELSEASHENSWI